MLIRMVVYEEEKWFCFIDFARLPLTPYLLELTDYVNYKFHTNKA